MKTVHFLISFLPMFLFLLCWAPPPVEQVHRGLLYAAYTGDLPSVRFYLACYQPSGCFYSVAHRQAHRGPQTRGENVEILRLAELASAMQFAHTMRCAGIARDAFPGAMNNRSIHTALRYPAQDEQVVLARPVDNRAWLLERALDLVPYRIRYVGSLSVRRGSFQTVESAQAERLRNLLE